MKTEIYLLMFLATAFLEVESQYPKYRPPEEHCRKYCFKDCDQYKEINTTFWSPSYTVYYTTLNSEEFQNCMNVRFNCDCANRATLRNPLLVFGLILTGIAVILAFIRHIRRRRRLQESVSGFSRNAVISYPITPTVSSIYNGEHRTAGNQGNNTASTFCIENPAFSNSTNDLPPEYLPPPSYQECFNYKAPNSNENEIKKEEKL